MPKQNTANSILPHTEAKLQLYTGYLERYLTVLLSSPWIQQVNIYDLFCGAGIYSDGKSGSALRAVDAITVAQQRAEDGKKVTLYLNDRDKAKTDRLKRFIDERAVTNQVDVSVGCNEAEDLFQKLSSGYRNQPNTTRNLVFIDPYGYKAISKKSIEDMLCCGRTEIILFLPIEQMYRFQKKAMQDDSDISFAPLRSFVEQFGLDTAVITSEGEFITALADRLSLGRRYLVSPYNIKNHSGRLYGMFFITPHIYGLEKILEVKWSLDNQAGSGFANSPQLNFILALEKEEDLRRELQSFLSIERTNIEVYRFILGIGFLPKQAREHLLQWQVEGSLTAIDQKTGKPPPRKGTFKIGWNAYKNKDNSIRMKMNGDGHE